MGYEIRPGHSRAVKNCIFCGHCADRQICKYDSKQSTLVTHAPIAERNGVEIIANARALRILIDRDAGRPIARGVLIKKLDLPDEIYPGDDFADWDRAKEITILAKKVIVSCGDLETPPLMYASGYGSKEDCGANLKVENPNVGKNIDGHYGEGGQPGVTGIFDEDVAGMDGGWGVDALYHFQTKIGKDRIVLLNGYGSFPRLVFGTDSLNDMRSTPSLLHLANRIRTTCDRSVTRGPKRQKRHASYASQFSELAALRWIRNYPGQRRAVELIRIAGCRYLAKRLSPSAARPERKSETTRVFIQRLRECLPPGRRLPKRFWQRWGPRRSYRSQLSLAAV